MKKKPIDGWIGIDSTSHVFDRYGVLLRPATIVVDAEGKVVSNSVAPDALSSAQLVSLAKGSSHAIAQSKDTGRKSQSAAVRKRAFQEQFSSAGASNPKQTLFSISLTTAITGGRPHLYVAGAQSYDVLDASLKVPLQLGLGYNNDRITMDEIISPKQVYNLSVQVNDVPHDVLQAAIEAAISSGTSTRIDHHKAEEDVLLLRTVGAAPAAAGKQDSGGLAFYDERKSSAVMMTATSRQIAAMAEDALTVPVLDESVSGTTCSANSTIRKGDQVALRALLERQCGLTLSPGRRVVDRITVTPAVR